MTRFLTRRLIPFLTFYVIVQAAVRFALLTYPATDASGAGWHVAAAFLIGLVFDLASFVFVIIPVMFYMLSVPRRAQGGQMDRYGSTAVFFLFAFVMLFSGVGEWFFWDEFLTRYNFIAVDYLVYTHEVVGNIVESYPIGLLLSLIALGAAASAAVYYRYAPRFLSTGVSFGQRAGAFGILIILCAVSFFGMRGSYAEIGENRFVNEIARNGTYELFSAFRNNKLDYDLFYINHPEDKVAAFLRETLGAKEGGASPLDRMIVNKAKRAKPYNLVMVTVESLSADYLKRFGNNRDITPKLDALIPQSLFFSELYATGTRTVYGLSALTLSIPPMPGNSIVRRADNGNMASIGQVLREKGYSTKFIYGGEGYFDNMNAFYAANGYEIIDRSNMDDDQIEFENIWGVSDEDLYRQVMAENDKAHAAGKPFFDMVMTTSNHRPYTFPEGRIDRPSKTGGREGGVKYTDWSIDYFLTEAAKKPWFKDTIFVIVADHTAGSSGKSDLDPDKYHIPMWVYAPGIIKPGEVDWMTSQIDVVPTILGLMGVSYDSRFYGVDVLKQKPERAFISNYQQLGYINKDGLVILKPVEQAKFFTRAEDGTYTPHKDVPPGILDEAVGYFQGAAQWERWSRTPE